MPSCMFPKTIDRSSFSIRLFTRLPNASLQNLLRTRIHPWRRADIMDRELRFSVDHCPSRMESSTHDASYPPHRKHASEFESDKRIT